MPFSNLDLKRVYYYVICVMAFFVLMWGVVDLTSSSIGLFNLRGQEPAFSESIEEVPIASEKGEQFFDTYYQKKMLSDRFFDSPARIVVGGLI
ncbi:MAG: hypothetical protein HQ596_02710, partial [Candidatus Saganbacteria bacterium]|nr:hypothetical protein [Candidatus Saganbacteria bacterium]